MPDSPTPGSTGSSNQGNQDNQSGSTGSNNQGNQDNQSGATGAFVPPPIVNFSLNETIDISGARITNQIGSASDGTEVVHTTFNTTDLSGVDVTINENLVEVVTSYYNDEVDPNSPTNLVLNKIKDYASKIQCNDFQGKGTIEDYTGLFQAASKIANDATQISLNVDIEGFNEFGSAADDLSKLFNSFIIRLQNVSIISDLSFLQSIAIALEKIWNLSEVFGRFKQTILATTSVHLPKSSHDATSTIQSVMLEINCAMNYINYFVNPSSAKPEDADLSATEQNIITNAVATIEHWSTLCKQGVTIAMANDPDVIYMSTTSSQLKSKTQVLRANTLRLQSTLAFFNITAA